MKKLNILVLFILLMQSCQIYQPVSISEIKTGKTYELTLLNGQRFETRCQRVNENSIFVEITENIMELPKSKIDKAKRKKTSVLRLAGGLTLATVGAVLLINSADKEVYQLPVKE
ncbi:hypothetical protein SB49_01355 [Sediminicola sp. YIK13]|uniref:hypothetical protein n=1 Tax=Sediminicola sp. YIK13 TaxID=1453352 RepID=UPI00072223AD|nr:hypothetical protein [Sediminicola sp. YIK13]ALM06608.1 hypothetical protein SB49_01355 [Sediminicola sp. YIK13]